MQAMTLGRPLPALVSRVLGFVSVLEVLGFLGFLGFFRVLGF
jgi:hypothetical protein